KCKNILLTTFPETTTKNVGDAMISDSFVKLLNQHVDVFNFVTVFRGTDLDKLDLRYIKNIFAPGFSVVPGTHPKNYKLFKDINRLKDFRFYPAGCSYQHFHPSDGSFENRLYDAKSISFLKYLNELFGPLPVRDKKIEQLMSSLSVSSIYSGDLVLFDPDLIDSPYKGINKIESLAFSVQHKEKYIDQSISIIKALISALPETKIYITFHGEENLVTDKIKQFANEYSIECVPLSGSSQQLDFYNSIDFHVGYRLHGHISFLRRRKPSILFVEDARAYGFAKTESTSLGCFQAMDGDKVSDNIEEEALAFIRKSLSSNFMEYEGLFRFIDSQYYEVIEPYFSRLGKMI
ncbi:polysaccharide pyruvyl transferase family protein, partial [Salinivibrio sp. IB643]|uniref:polysaccharide pyruvyl transferase family protein n=1 Tax=Salinivibrio sp. IB643 TaxID=1909445 RepID=UPI0009CFC435